MQQVNNSRDLAEKQSTNFTAPEQHGLPKAPAHQKLSPLDMNMPRVNNRWILCFSLPPSVDKAQIYDNLELGLARTISSIPWLAGNLVSAPLKLDGNVLSVLVFRFLCATADTSVVEPKGPEDGCDPKNNRIQIVDSLNGVKFLYKDLSGVLPSYAELEKDHFPLSKLSTADVSPLGIMPGPPQPIMAAQANFIEGGLLLTIGIHHSACDAFAVNNVLNTWAQNMAATSGYGHFSEHDPPSNDRGPLMEGISGASLADFPEYVLKPTPTASTIDVNTHQIAATPFELPPMKSHVFYFSPTSLAELKISAASYSTNDALNAFIWRHMTIARNPLSVTADSEEKTTAFLFAVNIRSRTSPPLPPTYLGNASTACITPRLPISTLLSPSGLIVGAATIRKSLGGLNTPSRVPLTIGLLDSRGDPSDFKFAYNGFLGPDVSATSWADLSVYEHNWGPLLGKVERFRIPGEGADGALVVFPRIEDGGLEVMVALEAEAMRMLIGNGQFVEVAELWA